MLHTKGYSPHVGRWLPPKKRTRKRDWQCWPGTLTVCLQEFLPENKTNMSYPLQVLPGSNARAKQIFLVVFQKPHMECKTQKLKTHLDDTRNSLFPLEAEFSNWRDVKANGLQQETFVLENHFSSRNDQGPGTWLRKQKSGRHRREQSGSEAEGSDPTARERWTLR